MIIMKVYFNSILINIKCKCIDDRPDRTFRFEERDQYGVVHGRYGYYDQTGKFRIVNYSAHPEHGFKAEGDFGPK